MSENGTSQRKLAEKYHVSPYLIRSILNGDKNLAQKISHKKEENTPSVLAFMDSKKNDVCGLIDKLLAAMGDKRQARRRDSQSACYRYGYRH